MHAEAAPRSLTQMLREWDNASVVDLLFSRPDVAAPPPTDFSQIASRATTRHSVTAALSQLTTFELWVAGQAAARTSSFTADDFVRETLDVAQSAGPVDVPVEAAHVESALDRLLHLALIWGGRPSLRPVRAMVALLSSAETQSVPVPVSPQLGEAPQQPAALADKVAAGSAFEFVRRLDVLVEHCDHQPIRLVRDGAISTRHVQTLGELLDISTPLALAHLEVARAAGLLGTASVAGHDVLLPATGFDAWQGCTLAEQWRTAALAWYDHHPRSGPRWLKDLALQAFGGADEPRMLTVDDVLTWLAWQRPRRPATADRQVTLMLEQAAWLGVTGLGSVSTFGVELWAHKERADLSTLHEQLPTRLDHVLVQADLTAIAPGPLTVETARDLGALADVESRGGATVYRFTAESLRRARQLGWTSDDILDTLRRHSRTPLPQPLTYLVADLERTLSPGGVGSGLLLSPAADRHLPPRRAAAPAPSVDPDPEGPLDPALVRSIIAALRDDESLGELDKLAEPFVAPENVFDVPIRTLREAVESGEVVWFGYVDGRGVSAERRVHARSVEEGVLAASDVKTGEDVVVPLRRITAAHILRGGQ